MVSDEIELRRRVQEIANEANERDGRKICLLITIDVENAFNSAPWTEIMEELKKGI